jgi:hypothetical protein
MVVGLQVPAVVVRMDRKRESRGCLTMTTTMSSDGLNGASDGGGCVGPVIKEQQFTAEALAGQDSLASNNNNNDDDMNFIGVIEEGGFFKDVSSLDEGLLQACGNDNDNKAEEGPARWQRWGDGGNYDKSKSKGDAPPRGVRQMDNCRALSTLFASNNAERSGRRVVTSAAGVPPETEAGAVAAEVAGEGAELPTPASPLKRGLSMMALSVHRKDKTNKHCSGKGSSGGGPNDRNRRTASATALAVGADADAPSVGGPAPSGPAAPAAPTAPSMQPLAASVQGWSLLSSIAAAAGCGSMDSSSNVNGNNGNECPNIFAYSPFRPRSLATDVGVSIGGKAGGWQEEIVLSVNFNGGSGGSGGSCGGGGWGWSLSDSYILNP